MAPILPFDEFLLLLRSRGYSVGVYEHLALAHLLEGWPGTSSPEFGDAVAALIARNEVEVGGIRRLYDQFYAPIEEKADSGGTGGDRRAEPSLRTKPWLIAVGAAIMIAALGLWGYYARVPSRPDQSRVAPPITAATGSDSSSPPVSVPPPPPPPLPEPARRIERRFVAELFGGAFLLMLGVAWAGKTRDARRRWLRDAWSAALARLPGPYHFNTVLRDRSVRLPRMDIEDAATILGRAVTLDAQTRELDVRRTLRQTLRSGLLPQLIFKPRRSVPLILVFQDISSEMRVWRDKVDTFLVDLARQGIPLERWYFDADLRRVSERPLPGNVDLESVLRRRPNAPTLVISSGSGLDAVPATAESQWVQLLANRNRRTWLTPISDIHLWTDRLRAVPVHVWPMTRRGLAQAARDLVGIDAEPSPQALREIEEEGTVTTDDLERMKRLVSLVPYPRPELIEVLRRRFAPDIPDAVVLHLFSEAREPSMAVLRLPDAVIRRAAESMRRDTPRLETMARRLLLQILLDSEPAAGSAAHERWQLAVTLQELALADLDGRDPSSILARLSTLADGPIWEEVQRFARLAPAEPARVRQTDAALRTGGGRRGANEAPTTVPDAASESMPWTWPALREFVPAIGAGLVVVVIAWRFGVLPVRALSHVTDAYTIDVSNLPSRPVELRVRRAANAPPDAPRLVTLYKNNSPYRARIDASGEGSLIQLRSEDGGNYYRAQAVLPDGELAMSPPVWVQSDRLLTVLIDASPWANVSIAGASGQIAAQPTPFSAALEPGVYQLHFDNGGLTPSMDQRVTIDPGNRVFRFTMPNFDPGRTANELTGAGQPSK